MVSKKIFSAEVFVIGGGAAGAFAAVKAREYGAKNVLSYTGW